MNWWRRQLKRQEMERHLDAELRFHFDALVADNLRAGMSQQQALRSARLQFGGVEQVKEECRDARGTLWVETLLQDILFALRTLRKNPGFTFAALVALALGIGANTAIFSVVDAVLLKPLTYPDPDRIIQFMLKLPTGTVPGASVTKFNVWREQTRVFDDVSGYYVGPGLNLTSDSRPEQLRAMYVTANYFRLFGAPILQGRAFIADEDRPNGGHFVVLSFGLWQRRFAGDPHVVGTTLALSGDPYTIVGVMGPGFSTDPVPAVDVWIPCQFESNSTDQAHFFLAAARLRPGITLDMAKAQMEIAADQFRHLFPGVLGIFGPQDGFTVEPLRDVLVGEVRSSLLVLSAAVGLVLLIACANVANLLLVRASVRKREIAIRASMGAGRSRIIRQLLTESVVLSIGGGFAGLALGIFGVRALLAINPGNIPRIGEHGLAITADWRVLVFALLLSVTTGILFGVIPAFEASSADLGETLKEGGGRTGTGSRQNKARALLVVGEVALALILLIGSGLLIRTFYALQNVDPGFDGHNVLTMGMSFSGSPFKKTSQVSQLIHNAVQRIDALPGVLASGLTSNLPFFGHSGLPFTIVGRPLANGSSLGRVGYVSVSAGYFDVFRIPMRRGRVFIDRDEGGAPPVAIINQAMARTFWMTGDPLADRIVIGQGYGPEFADSARQIVGVVGDIRDEALNRNPQPIIYVPIAQLPDGITALMARINPVAWIVRTRVEPHTLSSAIETELRQASGGLPVGSDRSMQEIESQSTARQDFNMLLMTIFGSSALLLAAIGIYGLMAYSVQQRAREIGIRLALGAEPSTVRSMILLKGMRLALIGVAIGIAAAFGLTRLLASLLFGVQPHDRLVFVGIPIALIGVAFLACYVPARRATRINPQDALRWE